MRKKGRTTPEAEAGYAIAYGTPRDELSSEGQVVYDQMKEGKAARGDSMSVADVESANRVVILDAKRALDEGRRVFLCRVPMMFDRLIAAGTAGLPGPSSVIESIENLGWRLDQMSWVPRAGGRAEGIFLFRRHVQ